MYKVKDNLITPVEVVAVPRVTKTGVILFIFERDTTISNIISRSEKKSVWEIAKDIRR